MLYVGGARNGRWDHLGQLYLRADKEKLSLVLRSKCGGFDLTNTPPARWIYAGVMCKKCLRMHGNFFEHGVAFTRSYGLHLS